MEILEAVKNELGSPDSPDLKDVSPDALSLESAIPDASIGTFVGINPEELDDTRLLDLVYERIRESAEKNLIQVFEKEITIRALRETGGNQVKTSALLGITRTTLRKRIETYGLGDL